MLLTTLGISGRFGLAQENLGAVRLDGTMLFRVGSFAEQDGKTRARQIEKRLSAILEVQNNRPSVRFASDDKFPANKLITVAGRPIVTVTPVDAEENGTTHQLLAAHWAGIIETTLVQAAQRRQSGPDRFVTSVQSSIQNAFARVLESAIVIVPKALAAIMVIATF